MTDLKRTIAGVALHVDTNDPEKVRKIKSALDAAMKAHIPGRAPASGPASVDSIFGSFERIFRGSRPRE